MSENGEVASIGRRILSWYIDYLFFAVVWVLLTYVTGPFVQSGDFLLSLVVFATLRGILGRILLPPGGLLLSIDEAGNVDPAIRDRESWLTILLGVLILLGGTKQLGRWTQIDAVWPYFGFIPSPVEHIVISIVVGLISLLAGGLILKLRRAGQILGILVSAVYLVSAVLSWQLWDDVVVRQIHARRAVQGLPVRPGEEEFMQALYPEALIAILVLVIVLLLIPTRRFAV